MAIASFSGLASGIDSAALISGLGAVARQPITRLQTSQTTLKTQAARVDDLSSKLTALATAARALDTTDEVLATRATTANSSVVSASATTGAATGAYSLHVTSLAKATRAYADPVAASDQAGLFGTGTLSLTIGGTTTDLSISASDTLSSVADKINNAGIGASAGLVYDGANWRLAVNGTDTGTPNAVTFGESPGLTLGLNKPANLIQPAANAAFEIDGLPVSSASNTVTTAINGVTLGLAGVSDGAATTVVRVDRDSTALQTKVSAFVSAYNAVMNAISSETPQGGIVKAGALAGDSTLRNVQSALRSTVGSTVAGLTGAYTNLASIGISLDRYGTMSLDTAKLSTATAKDPAGVSALFASQTGATGVMRSLTTTVDGYVTSGTGVLATKAKSLRDRATGLQKTMDAMELRVTKYEDTLKKQFASLESLISGMNSQSAQLASVIASNTNNNNK